MMFQYGAGPGGYGAQQLVALEQPLSSPYSVMATASSITQSVASGATSGAPTLVSARQPASLLQPAIPVKLASSTQTPTFNSSASHPRLISTKYEDGMLKPVYDPDELQKWRDENGIPSPKSAPADEVLPLLPMFTGGHDPRHAGGQSESPRKHSSPSEPPDEIPQSTPHTHPNPPERFHGNCFTCGVYGHQDQNCNQLPTAQACFHCGEYGHGARDCPQRPERRPSRNIDCYNCGQLGHYVSWQTPL